jgi:hypothetical protein
VQVEFCFGNYRPGVGAGSEWEDPSHNTHS